MLAIKQAIPRGLILHNNKSEDTHNPMDRQLEIYTYVDLPTIDPKFRGVAKIKIIARLSLAYGTLTIRTIQKNFSVEQ